MLYRLSHRFSVDTTGRPLALAGATMAEAGAAYRAGRLDVAERCCREVLAREPHHAEAPHLLGVICTDRGETGAALEWLHLAERENPDVARLQYHIGNALAAEARHAEAEARFRRALALTPDSSMPATISARRCARRAGMMRQKPASATPWRCVQITRQHTTTVASLWRSAAR